MKKKLRSKKGYVTIEAILSLVFFLMAIMFIYSQIKVVIAENIMQNAVNNMAKEVSSYVYILDKLGMILEHKEDEGKDINTAIKDTKATAETCIGDLKAIFGDDDDMVGNLQKFVDDVKSGGTKIKNDAENIDKDDLKEAGVLAAESAVKVGSNFILSKFYTARVKKYLPMDEDKFCRYFNIEFEEGKSAFSFDASRVFPTLDNNSVFVAVTYQTESPIKFIPLKRKICKYAYSAAWVSSNANEIKKSSDSDSNSSGAEGKGR